MRIQRSIIKNLSGLGIDTDKDWKGYDILNAGDIEIKLNMLKFTDGVYGGVIKGHPTQSNVIQIQDRTGTAGGTLHMRDWAIWATANCQANTIGNVKQYGVYVANEIDAIVWGILG